MFDRRQMVVGAVGVMAGLSACGTGQTAQGRREGKNGGTAAMPGDSHMPLETAAHERTFMQWPVNLDIYDRRGLRAVQSSIAIIANAIADFEPVVMLAGADHHAQARALLGKNVELWDVPTDDLWCRDAGPTFVKNSRGALAIAHIKFNGWGNKQPHDHDARIAEAVAARLGVPILDSGLVGEGGGIEHDGAGTLMAHASCWVNPNRNAGSQDEIGQKLLAALGGKKMIWAPGISGADITDYHIDALARFVAPGNVLIQLPPAIDKSDPWSRAAFQTYDILQSQSGADGQPLQITKLAEPIAIRSRARDFVASYVNYYVCNGAVIAAQFGDKAADEKARAALQSLHPDRSVIMLNVDPIGAAGGGIHCATQQQPKTGRA
jgi:agmatine deiminase